MKKLKLIVSTLIFVSLFGCANSDNQNSNKSENDTAVSYNSDCLRFESVDDGYKVVGVTNYNVENIYISSMYNEKPIIGIEKGALFGCYFLKNLTLPFIDTYLGYYFGATEYRDNSSYVPESLKTITILGGTSIPEYAFYECSSLTMITIPSGVTSIGSFAFDRCSSLKNLTLPFIDTYLGYYFGATEYRDNSSYVPESLKTITILGRTSIPKYAFYECSSLTMITIPSGVTSIGSFAFDGCSSLERVNYEGTISQWASIDFSDLVDYPRFSNPLSMKKLYIDGKLFQEENIVLDGIEEIGSFAFAGCDFIKTITIPSSVKSIGFEAFYGCLSSLQRVDYEGTISEWASIDFGSTITNLLSIKKLFINGKLFQEENIILEGIEKIGSFAFSNCDFIKTITIPSSVTSIGYAAFSDCSTLTNITIPYSVTSIGAYAFEYCYSLTIYCEASSKPSEWNDYWNPTDRPVYWGNEWHYDNGVPTLN